MTIAPLFTTAAAMLSNWRRTGKPAGPEPITFTGKFILSTLPLPANISKDGASIKAQLAMSFVGSFTTRKPVTVVSSAVRSSRPSFRQSV
jgi:hypothetical protein